MSHLITSLMYQEFLECSLCPRQCCDRRGHRDPEVLPKKFPGHMSLRQVGVQGAVSVRE